MNEEEEHEEAKRAARHAALEEVATRWRDTEEAEMIAGIHRMLTVVTGESASQTTSTREQFFASLPILNSRRNARRYITRVASGFQAQHCTALEAKTLLYMAQLALAAAPTPTPRPVGRAKTTKGFAS